MTAEVHVLPGVFRADLEGPLEPAAVLAAAADIGLRDVVVVGRTIAGDVVVCSSQVDADAVVGLLARGQHYLVASAQAHEDEAGAAG